MEAHLRAGIAVFNAGHFHAAHDAWEGHWLDLEAGTDDERFLHGLIQFTAAVHHAHEANWAGVQGLAESGAGYLAALPADFRGVNLGAVRRYLQAAATDPEHVERVAAPNLEHRGAVLDLSALAYPAIAVAASVLAEEYPVYDEAIIERAVGFADEVVEARDAGSAAGDDRFVTLVTDFVVDAEHRDLVYDRLESHVERRVGRLEDADGLFD